MTTGHSFGKTIWMRSAAAGLALGLLLFPASRNARAAFPQSASAEAQSEAEQAKREREQERREREQDKREAEQDKQEHLQDLYDDGREALEDEHYEKAAQLFTELARQNGPQTDAALVLESLRRK